MMACGLFAKRVTLPVSTSITSIVSVIRSTALDPAGKSTMAGADHLHLTVDLVAVLVFEAELYGDGQRLAEVVGELDVEHEALAGGRVHRPPVKHHLVGTDVCADAPGARDRPRTAAKTNEPSLRNMTVPPDGRPAEGRRL